MCRKTSKTHAMDIPHSSKAGYDQHLGSAHDRTIAVPLRKKSQL
jgi:hypothetical protein